MNSTILAIRAITSAYALRFLWPLLWIGLGVYIVLMILIGWIAVAVSSWWWLLAVVPSILIIIGIVLWILVRTLALRLSPPLNARQKSATKKFVKHIDTVAEHIGTPKFVIIFRVVKDVLVRPTSSRTFISEIAEQPGEMRRDFDELKSLF